MVEVKVESHKMGVTSYRLTSLSSMSIGHPLLRYDFFKIWPWKSEVKVMGEGNVDSHKVGVTSYRLTFLSFHVNRPFHSWDTAFSKFDPQNPRSRSNDMMLHNYRFRQFHRTSNGINPSSGFRDMSLAQVLPDLTSFWPKGKPIWGKWANNYDFAQLQV